MSAIYSDCSEFITSITTRQMRDLVPELEIHEGTPDEGEVIRFLHGRVAAVVGRTYVPAHILEGADRLKVVVFLGAGASSYIDLAAAERLGIPDYTLRRMIRRGSLPAKREIGGKNSRLWINPADVDKVLKDYEKKETKEKKVKLETVKVG